MPQLNLSIITSSIALMTGLYSELWYYSCHKKPKNQKLFAIDFDLIENGHSLPSGLIAFTGFKPFGFCCFLICVTFSSVVFSKSGSPRMATILHFRNNSKCVQNVSPGSTGTFSWNSFFWGGWEKCFFSIKIQLTKTKSFVSPSSVRSQSFRPTIHQSCSFIFVWNSVNFDKCFFGEWNLWILRKEQWDSQMFNYTESGNRCLLSIR